MVQVNVSSKAVESLIGGRPEMVVDEVLPGMVDQVGEGVVRVRWRTGGIGGCGGAVGLGVCWRVRLGRVGSVRVILNIEHNEMTFFSAGRGGFELWNDRSRIFWGEDLRQGS